MPPVIERTRTVAVSDLAELHAHVSHPERLSRVLAAHREKKQLPPIRVFVGANGERQLTDGNHRLVAARRLGLKHIRVIEQIEPANAVERFLTGLLDSVGDVLAGGIR